MPCQQMIFNIHVFLFSWVFFVVVDLFAVIYRFLLFIQAACFCVDQRASYKCQYFHAINMTLNKLLKLPKPQFSHL